MAKGSKLLTADRIGIGMVVAGALAWPLGIAPLGLVGLGVIGPPLLRELGVLRDADDYTRQAMYRAGFHAMLLLVLFLLANRIMAYYAGRLPEPFGVHGLYFTLEFLIQIAIVVFAVSYVVQYWGPRVGVARVLIGGVAFLIINSAAVMFSQRNHLAMIDLFATTGAFLAIAAVIGFLSWMTLQRPRAGGCVLLLLMVLATGRIVLDIAGLDSAPEHLRDQGMFWADVMALVWAIVLFGAMGVALLRNPDPA